MMRAMFGFSDGPDSHEKDDDFVVRRYRAIFISDLHLGTPGCQAAALLGFMRSHPSDYLYLVGDIVDGWQLRRRWYWPQAHNDVIQKLLRRARKGCRVIFVPGNHDEFARAFIGHQFGGIDVVEDAVHTTADGRRLWVTHGDYFDGVIQCAKWLAYVGDNLYEFGIDGAGWAELAPSLGWAAPKTFTVTVTGSPTGGTFTLSVGGQTTSGVAFNATSTNVRSALEALSSVGSGHVTVTGSAGGPYTVVFDETVSGTLTGSGASLTGGTSPDVVIS